MNQHESSNHTLAVLIITFLIAIMPLSDIQTQAFYEEGNLQRSLRISTDSVKTKCKTVSVITTRTTPSSVRGLSSIKIEMTSKCEKDFDIKPETPETKSVFMSRLDKHVQQYKKRFEEANKSLSEIKAPSSNNSTFLRQNLQAKGKSTTTIASRLPSKKRSYNLNNSNVIASSRLGTLSTNTRNKITTPKALTTKNTVRQPTGGNLIRRTVPTKKPIIPDFNLGDDVSTIG